MSTKEPKQKWMKALDKSVLRFFVGDGDGDGEKEVIVVCADNTLRTLGFPTAPKNREHYTSLLI